MHVTSPLFYRLTQFSLYRIVKFFRLWMVSWKTYVSSTTDVLLHPVCACINFGYWPIPSIFNCSAPFNFLKGSRQRGSLPIRRALKSIRPPPQPHHHFRPSDRELGKKKSQSTGHEPIHRVFDLHWHATKHNVSAESPDSFRISPHIAF
jgi:hypothetical protein